MSSTSIPGFAAVIPAGGAGTRLWPLSRAGSPKFLHDLTGTGRTLLQGTWDRLAPLAGDGIMVVTGARHIDAVRSQLPDLPDRDVLAEPSPRDSMAAIGLAAAVLARRDTGVVIGSFAADHVIDDDAAFADAITQAVAVARDGYVVTVGITPTHPATGFGYIEAADALQVPGAPDARAVASFVEKPDAGTAADYLAGGRHLWNGGMFVVRATVLLDHLAITQPELRQGIDAIADAVHAGDAGSAFTDIWPTLTKIAIDHAIAEPVAVQGGVAVVPGRFGWDDVGDWHSLADLLPAHGGPAVLGAAEQTMSIDSSGILVPGADRLVAVIGIDDVVVVDTPDALLVTTRDKAQQVKQIVETLKADGRTDLV